MVELRGEELREADLPFNGVAVLAETGQLQEFTSQDMGEALLRHPLTPPDPVELLKTFPFLEVDTDREQVVIPAGDWQIDVPLETPIGWSVTIKPGAVLRFAAQAFMVVNGPLMAGAEAAEQIRLLPLDTDAGWPGLVVLGRGHPSRITRVSISGTRAFNGVTRGWFLTAGTLVYNSPVHIHDLVISDARGEDGLNLVRSDFQIEKLQIDGTRSDALDADFSNGTIANSVFRNVGGDGVDVSGAILDLRSSRFENVYDKAISLGEASTGKFSDIEVDTAGTAVASKDASSGTGNNIRFSNIDGTPFMAYTKKPEYGDARLTIVEAKGDAEAVGLVQTGSRLSVNGQEIPTTELDVEMLYEQGRMKK